MYFKSIPIKFKKLYNQFIFKELYYLHIGKTAGSWFRENIWYTSMPNKYKIKIGLHGAEFYEEAKQSDLVIIPVRDPLSRIISGFESRRRQGRPVYNNPWSENENIFFNKVNSFNEFVYKIMIEKNGINLWKEFRKINIHGMYDYKYYFKSTEAIKKFCNNHNVYILRQEHLKYDLNKIFINNHVPVKNLSVLSDNRVHSSVNSNKLKTEKPSLYESFIDTYLLEEYNIYNTLALIPTSI